jgi:AraC-like DNA-binding protein
MRDSRSSIPPAVTVTDIRDAATAGRDLELVEHHSIALESRPLRARRVVVRLPSATVIYHATNRRLRARATVQEGLLAYLVFGPRAAGTVEGLPVRAGMLVASAPGGRASFVVNPGYESLAVLVAPDEVRRQLLAHQQDPEFRSPRGVEILATGTGEALALFRFGRQLAASASRHPERFADGSAARVATGARLFALLLAAIRAPGPFDPQGLYRTQRAYSRIVAAAEQRVLAKPAERVRVPELCRAANTSERTLDAAFRRVTGLSPVQYLIRMRLHRVRAALLAAAPGSTTVSAEALTWGFRHFGEFSRTYTRCFGERPSETLRRRQPSPGG